MRKVRCISSSDGSNIKENVTYRVTAYESDYLYVDINGYESGPWFTYRFIDVSFNEYLNRLK